MNAQVGLSAKAEYQQVAEKWCSILANRDSTILPELYHDDAVTWHNYDRKSMTMQEIAELVGVIFGTFKEMAFENIRRSFIEKGFVQQHDIVATHINGQSLNVAACVVVTVEGGKISRLEEYIDPAPLFAMMSPDS